MDATVQKLNSRYFALSALVAGYLWQGLCAYTCSNTKRYRMDYRKYYPQAIYGPYERKIIMKRKLMIFTVAALICMFSVSITSAQAYNGNIFIENKEVQPGESFTVRVSLSGNDQSITSLRIPIKFDNTYLTCTYVDFSGSIRHASMEAYSSINGGEVEIAYIPPVVNPMVTFTTDSGLVATLYFTADTGAPDVTVAVDSVYEDTQFDQFGTTFHLWRRVEAADGTGGPALVPSFAAGGVIIRSSTDVGDEFTDLLPKTFELVQNYPNPFNPTTTISFTLPEKTDVRLDIFNILGQSVTTLISGELPAGNHEAVWDAGNSPTGVYFYRLTAEKESITRKMLLLK